MKGESSVNLGWEILGEGENLSCLVWILYKP